MLAAGRMSENGIFSFFAQPIIDSFVSDATDGWLKREKIPLSTNP
jgi:hypothetical protein